MNEDKDWQDEFDELPVESQCRIKKVMQNLQALAPNLEEEGKRSEQFNALLECAKEMKDQKLLCKVLFCGAEAFDKQKPLPPDTSYPHERAKELDWLRHVASDNIELMPEAVEALEHCIMGGFDKALLHFGNVNLHKDEFEAILRYWQEALN